MRVNIVAGKPDQYEARIVPRLARVLAERTGWSLGPRCDGHAQVNLWLPYLNRAPCETRTAAWFTHREDDHEPKAEMWDLAARAVDLRVTSARVYLDDLERRGPTRLVIPPLDRGKFQPKPHKRRQRPVVGTSGWVYPWGRKGEELLVSLTRTKVGLAVDWRASGGGWPIPTKLYPWETLEQFYHTLDCYVCTSLIEGVGYGPLEALSCGVPVVVPWKVGVFDDLPEVEGVRHYRAGDLGDLVRALAQCLEDRVDVEGLRSLTAGYTDEAWAEGWEMAAREAMGLKVEEEMPAVPADPRPAVAAAVEAQAEPDPAAQPSWRGRAGLYMVAFGEPSRACATRAIAAWRKQMPGLPIALCSDRKLGPEDVLIEHQEVDIGARNQKVRVYDLAPADWDYVIYMDADTELRQPIASFIDWLEDGWELVVCINPGRFAVAENMGRADNTKECRETFDLWGTDQNVQYNGGVFAFRRSEATARLFHRWEREWAVYGKRDQGALLRALWHEPVRVWLQLPRVWNCVAQNDEKRPGHLKYPYDQPRDAAVMHYPMTARRWQGIVGARSDAPEAWARVREWERAHKVASK